MTCRWPRRILRSVCQRSKIQGLDAVIWFPDYNLRTLWPMIMKLRREVDYDWQMAPYNFEVSRSRVTGIWRSKNYLVIKSGGRCISCSTNSCFLLGYFKLSKKVSAFQLDAGSWIIFNSWWTLLEVNNINFFIGIHFYFIINFLVSVSSLPLKLPCLLQLSIWSVYFSRLTLGS